MDYLDFHYLFPPRPQRKINPKSFQMWEDFGYFGQPKMNGSCGVLFLNGDQASLWNRHGQQMTRIQDIGFSKLHRGEGWHVLVGEYMNKSKMNQFGEVFNHKFVIWDILVHNNRYLVGETFSHRLYLLDLMYGHEPYLELYQGAVCLDRHLYQIEENLFRVATFRSNFKAIYDEIVKTDMYEGLVLKKADSRLEYGSSELNNSIWQVKARKATRNYAF